MSECSVRKEVKIVNPQGLHARPSSLIVRTASRFKSSFTLSVEDRTANGRSIMEVMMLASPMGTQIVLEAEGEDAAELVHAVAALIDAGFDEKA
jgi:phosphocarrier protein HPr